MTRTAKLLLPPLFLLQILFFGFISTHRFLEGDEGFYLLASRLVLMHRKPYVDFFYTQAPLLPYVYALWMKCTTLSWISAKLFSALLTTLLGMLLYGHVCRLTRSWMAGLSAVVLFVPCTLVFAWFPVVKTYSLSELFLFSGYLIISRVSAASPRWIIPTAGLMLGLSVATRSYLVLLIPLFLWWILHNSDARFGLNSFLGFLGGFTVGIIPCLYLLLCSPDAFFFNNLGYHALRADAGLIGMWQEKFVVILVSFLGELQGNGIQNSILVVVSLALIFSIRKRKYVPRFAFQVAVAIGFISLLPTPVFPQYFCLCIPFLIVSTVCVANDLIAELKSRQERLVAALSCVALLSIYVAASVPDLRKYLITGDGINAVEAAPDKGDWRLERVLEVSRAVELIAGPGETVASFSPGDIFQTRATPLPGLESDFGLPISTKLTSQQRTRYHILSPVEVEANFAAHRPRVVLLRNQILVSLTAEGDRKWDTGENFRRFLRAQGYTLTRSIGGISIYVCCSNPDTSGTEASPSS